MSSSYVENNRTTQRIVWIYGPASIAFAEVSSRVHAPLQRVATSVRTLGTPSRESTLLDIESGAGGHGAAADEAKSNNKTSTSTDAVRDSETATSIPPVNRHGAAEESGKDRDNGSRGGTQTWWDQVCDFFHGFPEHLATVVWRTIGVVFRKAFLTSLANTLCGLFILGLAKGPDGVYANVSALSLVVACACGSGVVTGGCAALMFVFGTGKGVRETIEEVVQLSGVFIPAIAVGVTRGHIRGLSPAFTAVDALKVGGVGLGGLLACSFLYLCCVEIEAMLKSTKTAEVDS